MTPSPGAWERVPSSAAPQSLCWPLLLISASECRLPPGLSWGLFLLLFLPFVFSVALSQA